MSSSFNFLNTFNGNILCNIIITSFLAFFSPFLTKMSFLLTPKRIEYKLERNLLEKSVKRQFCSTVSILQVHFTYSHLLGPVMSFYRKSKINIKRNPNYEIGWFLNWEIIISHRLYAFHFTNDDFPL